MYKVQPKTGVAVTFYLVKSDICSNFARNFAL